MKITFKQYEAAVREARAYINRYDKVRWKVCELALSVCDTSHGGRKIESVFSLAKFADAIELDRKTLYEWCRIKRLVYDKLPATETKNTANYLYSDLRDVVDKVKPDSRPKEVLAIWREQLSKPMESKKFYKYDKHLSAILYNAQRPIMMNLVEKEIIEKISGKCALISKLLDKELELRKKFSMEERLLKKQKTINNAISKARITNIHE